MNFSELNKDNFLFFAIKHDENPTTSTQEEFEEDLSRFKYVKRWLRKYHNSGVINNHLLLNHILIIFNCWDDAALPMFFLKIDFAYWTYSEVFFLCIWIGFQNSHTASFTTSMLTKDYRTQRTL